MPSIIKATQGRVQDNAPEEVEKIDVDFPYFRVVMIIVSFALGLLDMMFLYRAVHNLTGLGNGASMFAAFAIAEVANFTAFMMGVQNGENSSKRAINKNTGGLFAAWVVLGIGYATIRVLNFIKLTSSPDFSLEGELLQFFILGISYIGTGTTIWSSARRIFDRKANNYRKAKKEFEFAKQNLDNAFATLQSNYSAIINYDINYKNLDTMKNNIEKNIELSERATMNDLGGKVLKSNPGANPALVKQVIDDILEERKEK